MHVVEISILNYDSKSRQLKALDIDVILHV